MDLADRLLQNGLHLFWRRIVPEAPPDHPPLTIQHHEPVGARHPEPGEERAALAGVCPHLKEIHIPFETRSQRLHEARVLRAHRSAGQDEVIERRPWARRRRPRRRRDERGRWGQRNRW